MGNCVWEQAAGLELFQGLPPMLLKELLNGAKWVEYPKKKNVFSAGESVRTVYVVLDGKVMLYNLTRHGNRKILFFLGRGKLLNHNICDTRPVSVFCETVCPAVLLEIPL